MNKYYFRLRTILLISFMMFLSACAGGSTDSGEDEERGGNGVLTMTVKGPFGTELDKEEQSYYDGQSKRVSKSVVISRYGDYGEKYNENSFAVKPYCRVGGTYQMNVNNKNSHGNYNKDIELYYCKTTLDLLNQIKIPSSWTDDNLSIYCNDGNLINFKELNLDFLTTKFNHYKVCVLKNEELAQKNTVVYGFEVGNKVIDSDSDYNFNPNGDNFIFATEGIEPKVSETLEVNEVGEIAVPYKEWPSGCNAGGSSYGLWRSSAQVTYTKGPAPGKGSTCWGLQQTTFNSQRYNSYTPDLNGVGGTNSQYCVSIFGGGACSVTAYQCKSYACDDVTTYILGQDSRADPDSIVASSDTSDVAGRDADGNLVPISINGGTPQLGFKWYKYDTTKTYQVSNFVFQKDSKEFIFTYNDLTTFYSLKETSEELDTPLSIVFSDIPPAFDLSRVAMFRSSSGNKKVYGYETPAKLKIQGEDKSTKAVYTISFSNNFDFGENDCMVSLASYGTSSSFTVSSGSRITCAPSIINLNSATIDSDFSPGISLTLFKNIILNLE